MSTLSEKHTEAIAQVGEWVRETSAGAVSAVAKTGQVEWSIPIEGEVSLALVLDANFPYSEPTLFVEGSETAKRAPHVERTGKLCLRRQIAASPSLENAVARVEAAYQEAIELLAENAEQKHVGDYLDDFAAYWKRAASSDDVFHVLVGDAQQSRLVTRATPGDCYIAEDPDVLSRVLKSKVDVRFKAFVIVLRELPTVADYPKTVADLRSLLAKMSDDGLGLLDDYMRTIDRWGAGILTGVTPTGVRAFAGIGIAERKQPVRPGQNVQDPLHKGFRKGQMPLDVLANRLELTRHHVDRIDSARTRRAHPKSDILGDRRVCLIGCGSLGSSIARQLAQSGIGALTLIDPEPLGWENIERHELGASDVRSVKSEALRAKLTRELPLVKSVASYREAWIDVFRKEPEALKNADLIISTCANWSAESALNDIARSEGFKMPILYGWLENYAVAAHVVGVGPSGACLRCGFEEEGQFLRQASRSPPRTPPGCAADVSLYGAIDMLPSQALISRAAIDVLLGSATPPIHRSWLAAKPSLVEVGADWTSHWLELHGPPPPGGTFVSTPWTARNGCSCRT